MELVSGYHLWPFHILILFFPLYFLKPKIEELKKKKDIWVWGKGLLILNKKLSFRYSEDKLRIDNSRGAIFSPEPRTGTEALTLVLLCSVCLGWIKAAKCKLIFPTGRWLEKWVKIQKFILDTHTQHFVPLFIRLFTCIIPFRLVLHYQSCQPCDIDIPML